MNVGANARKENKNDDDEAPKMQRDFGTNRFLKMHLTDGKETVIFFKNSQL